jgi:hypothetical protein
LNWTKKLLDFTFGPQWEFIFDFTVVNAKKPLFMTAREPFLRIESQMNQGQSIKNVQNLIQATFEGEKFFEGGNGFLVSQYYQKSLSKKGILVGYMGNHWVNDVLATQTLSLNLQMSDSQAYWESIAKINVNMDFHTGLVKQKTKYSIYDISDLKRLMNRVIIEKK